MTAISLLVVYLYSFVIHQFESPGPVERWMQTGIERHRLEQLNATGVLIPSEFYESECQRLLREEHAIVNDSDFPQDMNDLANYEKARHWLPRWPIAFWIAFTCSVLTAVVTASWLRGASWAAQDTEGNSRRDPAQYDHDAIREAVERRLTSKSSGLEPLD